MSLIGGLDLLPGEPSDMYGVSVAITKGGVSLELRSEMQRCHC